MYMRSSGAGFGRWGLTVCMCDEDLVDFPHLDVALLDTMLRCLPAVEEPNIAVQAQCKSGMVAR